MFHQQKGGYERRGEEEGRWGQGGGGRREVVRQTATLSTQGCAPVWGALNRDQIVARKASCPTAEAWQTITSVCTPPAMHTYSLCANTV